MDSQNQSDRYKKAKKYCKNGYSYYCEKKWDDAIVEYKKSILIQESLQRGRYHQDNAEPYFWIGNCYQKMGKYKKAITPYREILRIQKYLINYGCYTQNINVYTVLEESLQKSAELTDEQIKLYYSNLDNSIKHEQNGDFYRKELNFVKAIESYELSIAIEKESIGSDSTLSFLYRKIAYIVVLLSSTYSSTTNSMKDIIWDKMDSITDDVTTTPRNEQQSLLLLLLPYVQGILDGDAYHKKFQYVKAMYHYQKVSNETSIMNTLIWNTQREHIENLEHQTQKLTNKAEELKKMFFHATCHVVVIQISVLFLCWSLSRRK